MKRFYDQVAVEQVEGGWRVLLGGRAVKTQNGAPQIAPTRALAEKLANEWRAQGPEIDPTAFPARDMVDYAIDIVAPAREETIAKLLAFTETDTLCFRADPEDALYRKQLEVWEPLVRAVERRENLTLQRVSGIMHKPQEAVALARLRQRLESLDSFTLAALFTMASLGASLCVALNALEDDADPDALWYAANLEEEWQADLWGREDEAERRRATRREQFRRAFDFAKSLRS